MTAALEIVNLNLGTTAFSEASQCLKKFEYHQVAKLVRQPRYVSYTMRRGIWIHSAMEAHRKGQSWNVRLGQLRLQAQEYELEQEVIDKLTEEVSDVMFGYTAFWEADDAEYTSVAEERELRTPVGTPFELNGQTMQLVLSATLDGLVEHHTRGLGIWEYKSTSDIPGADWRAVDPQTAIQWFVAKRNGFDVKWILFDYLNTRTASVPQIKKDGYFYARDLTTTSVAFAKAEPEVHEKLGPLADSYLAEQRLEKVNDAKFYQRYPVLRPDTAVMETLKDVAGVTENIKTAARRGHYPRAFHPTTCRRFCSYGPLCALEYTLGRVAPAMREEDYVHDDGTREGRFDEALD